MSEATPRRVMVTGASGLVGRQVVALLRDERRPATSGVTPEVVALDLREPAGEDRLPGVVYRSGDIRDSDIGKTMSEYGVDTVVHLAAVVTPGPESTRELEYEIDVVGTRNVVDACIATGVRQFVYASSGAAYGYHASNPVPLRESDPLRGNEAFAYSWHKRLAEELLAERREQHPELGQLILRIGTILGERVASPITALFERPVVIGVSGSEAPFVLIWDEDVARCIVHGIENRSRGIYNLCGDGALTLSEIAQRLGRRYLPLPPWLLAAVLYTLQAVGVSKRGAEQVDFLRYRPVLCNEKLVNELGFTPRYTSEECFERYRDLVLSRSASPR